jgi:UDP-N-acetylglucosamine 2-epimerase (non-hydrolysing)
MILVVAGTRPEVIKLAPVYVKLRARGLETKWLFTGQQADIGQSAFDPFRMHPELAYELERPTGTLTELNALLATIMRDTIGDEMPEMVVVQGDTLTAAAAAQAAFLARIPLAHVEAGLRSWDTSSPYPEEACRVWIDAVADLKFAPTIQASMTLSGDGVWVTGNTVIDALKMIRPTPPRKGSYAVVTMHRRENLHAVRQVCSAIRELARDRVFDYIVWPVHPNPDVRVPVVNAMKGLRNVEIVSPLAYDVMVNLVRGAKMLLTDSGGLQEEALALGVPCLVMRNETERPEGVAAGGARLVGTDASKIVGWSKWIMDDHDEWERMATAPNPYGDGRAADRIAAVCKGQIEGRPVHTQMGNWKGARI